MIFLPPALQAPAMLQPPDHPACRGFFWVASTLLKLDGTPVERVDLYLDPARVQREVASAAFKDTSQEEAAWRLLLEGRIPIACRMVYLQDLGKAYHRRKVEELLRAHWPEPRFPSDHPVVRQFIRDLSEARNLSDAAEVVLDGGILRHRLRGGSWTEYRLRSLVIAIARSNLHVDAEQEVRLRGELASLLSKPGHRP